MKNSLCFSLILFCNTVLFAQEIIKEIKGRVMYVDTPLANAEITISGSDEITSTTFDGYYKVAAKPGDVLVFTYPSMRDMEIIVEDVTKILNIEMSPEINELDEVVVIKSKRRKQRDLAIDYDIDKSIINTGFGYLSEETTAYNLRVFSGSDLNRAAFDVIDAIALKIPGACTKGFSGDKVLLLRCSPRGIPVIYEVDGQIFKSAPVWLDISTIRRVAAVSGLQFVAKYGSIASGGVVFINTTSISHGTREPESGLPYDRAKLRNNLYAQDAITSEAIEKGKPSYLIELNNSATFETAKATYKKYKKLYGSSFQYVLDAYDYFVNTWPEGQFTDTIIDSSYNVFQENPIALKSLAYLYEAGNEPEKAHKIYKEIFMLRPNYAQSYMDLANSYREIGNYQKAATIYARYGYLLEEGFLKSKGKMFTNIIDREFNNLLALNSKKILSRKDLKNFVFAEEFNGTRLVFEWSDSEAEFELQFVNPKNHCFESEHSLLADANRIKDEKLSGYSSEEFLIDDTMRGTWLVNVKYLGNRSLTTTYIKATIYHNYGSPSQRKETKLLKMNQRNLNQKWFEISNAGIFASN